MIPLQPQGLRRADYLEPFGSLAVVRPAAPDAPLDAAAADDLEPFVLVRASGEITAFNGHVDLGTGVRTALAQIVAEELDVAFERVAMVLGDSAVAPDQGPTLASETIQLSAKPLQIAAAQARHWLIGKAAEALGVPAADLVVEDGVVQTQAGDNRRMTYGELIGGERIRLALAADAPVKPASARRIVGASPPRVDLPAKATGGLVYVHDMRLPGMLHGRVVRPPYAGFDSGDHVGRSLIGVDQSSISSLPGIVATVVLGDFVGVVAEREEQAEAAMLALKVTWRPTPRAPDLSDLKAALSANPSRPRVLIDRGDVEGAIAGAAKRLTRQYLWPYQMHASIGPSAALADVGADRARVWSGTQNPLWMRRDLALLLDLPEGAIEVVRMEAAGCYGRNGADDVTADAALLSRAVGRPVRVQLTRDQEHQWEPKGAAQLMNVDGGLDGEGGVAAYDFATRYPSNAAPTLALLLTGKVMATPDVTEMGDRTAIGPYDFANHRVTVHDMAPLARAAWLRGVSAMPNTFAHESYIDELASEAGVDPVAYRLRHLKDGRAAALVSQVAARVGWEPRTGARKRRDANGNLTGQGFAYAVYVHSKFPGLASAWSAWAADVAVNPATGEVSLTRVTVGQDSGLMINPEGVRHQIHGNVIQSTSRVLKEEVTFSDIAVTSRDWGTYPLLTFPELPAIDLVMAQRPGDEPLGVGESASVPSAAAIANAIYDATGVRFREPPFTPDRILAGLREAGLAGAAPEGPAPVPLSGPARKAPGWLRPLVAAALGAVGALGVASLPIRGAIAPIARPDPSAYSAETIARGKVLAQLGGCIVCHTAETGAELAGGRPFDTPFGRVYATNITPDEATGLGRWSFEAFARAMREGVARDGRHLFPVFPYTSFVRANEADLQALYAFLMAAPAVAAPNREPELRAPFGWRPLMAAWNTMFHRARAFRSDARTRRLVESGRLSRRGARALLRLSFAAQRARRGTRRRRPSRGRRGRGLVRAPAERRFARAHRLDGAGLFRLSADRPLGRARRGWRPHGAHRRGAWRRAGRGYSRHGALSRLACAPGARGGLDAKGPAGRGGEGARLRSGASLRRPNLFRRLRGLPRARTGRADVRREAVAGAEHRSSRRCARHGAARHSRRLPGAAWPRTAWGHAGLRALSRRCSARRSRGLSARPLRARPAVRGAGLRSARRISGDGS